MVLVERHLRYIVTHAKSFLLLKQPLGTSVDILVIIHSALKHAYVFALLCDGGGEFWDCK